MEELLWMAAFSKVENNRNILGWNMTVGRKPGTPKTGGRQKGTPNKKTQSFAEELAVNGFDLVKAMIQLFNTTQDERLKFAVVELMAKYKLAIPKAIEQPIEEPEEESASPLISIIDNTNE